MKITVTTLADEIFSLEVNEDMELENFKALLEFESGVPTTEMTILFSGRPLQDNKKKLSDYGVKDGEILLLQRMQGSSGRSNPGPQRTGGKKIFQITSTSLEAITAGESVFKP